VGEIEKNRKRLLRR